jgi:hypothetical protein
MDTEKKPDETTEKPKQGMAAAIGDLIVSGARVLAHSAAEAVVGRVKKASKKTRPVKAVATVMNKAKKSVVSKKAKAKASKTPAAPKKAAKKTVKKSTKKSGTKAKSTTNKAVPKKKKKAKSGRSRT